MPRLQRHWLWIALVLGIAASLAGVFACGSEEGAELPAPMARDAVATSDSGRAQIFLEGRGELLQVLSAPVDGGHTSPTGFVVRRFGALPGRVVLSFEDGPDPIYTPQILDILKHAGIRAAFFVIGRSAEAHPELLERIWNEGHELGNHTFTHAELADVSEERARIEIVAAQRVIESITGHTTMLFRAPDTVDVEPRGADELKPILLASRWRFISVLALNNPEDSNPLKRAWNGQVVPRTVDDIVESAWRGCEIGNIVRLHDGGGDRGATVAALPRIIERIGAAGYRFSTISELSGLPRSTLFPPVSTQERRLARIAGLVFGSARSLERLLQFLFVLSIVLGISRQVLVAGLALVQRRRERSRVASLPADFTLPVSVVIAAYNEEKVIERTVRSILDSDVPELEVVVVDDGSKDRTFQVVTSAFGSDPRVHCVRKDNGGKASALNYGLALARGEIIVGLDADTLFAPYTIRRLLRHFADPRVGAVAGNVRVGNANNILTKWQSLEYITSQNFDRRAYDLLNCITVVPGAIGAWRRDAIQAAGGYMRDTLAEDTDLTWKIRRLGWRICNENEAPAYTEAPESWRNLARQRYRWAFGTLQNLWKHRTALFHYGAFGWIALPSLWIHQILFQTIAPVMDLAILYGLFSGSLARVAGYYLLMVGFEALGAALALWMDGSGWRLLPWLFLQRFVYRQLMYYVVLKSLLSAILGGAVGWNKFERRGTARADACLSSAPVCST